MTSIEKTFLQIVYENCHSNQQNSQVRIEASDYCVFSDDVAAQLLELAKKQYTVPFLLQDLKNTACFDEIKRQSKMMMFNYYQIEQLTYKTAQLLDAHEIPYFLLKGISLSACYPVPEYRKLGDVDILIPDTKKLELAKKILAEHHYELEDEESDHHLTYFYRFANGRRYILEVHYRIVGIYHYAPANHVIEQVFACQRLHPVSQRIDGREYPVLPPTEYVFYMLHHMLKHYLYDGFGIRLLCDFSLYLEKNSDTVDFEQLCSWCQQSGIAYFYGTIMNCCQHYLGLSEKIPGKFDVPLATCDKLMTQILGGADVGQEKHSALVYSGTHRRVNCIAYFKEGHTQMKVRFPKLSRWIILWPVLWGMTFYIFMKNTYTVRHTTLRQTIKDFKKDNQRAESLHIFEDRH